MPFSCCVRDPAVSAPWRGPGPQRAGAVWNEPPPTWPQPCSGGHRCRGSPLVCSSSPAGLGSLCRWVALRAAGWGLLLLPRHAGVAAVKSSDTFTVFFKSRSSLQWQPSIPGHRDTAGQVSSHSYNTRAGRAPKREPFKRASRPCALAMGRGARVLASFP